MYNIPTPCIYQLLLLDNQTTSAGFHQLLFNGKAYGSGMYFATIVAGKHKARKKMILIK